jgi:NOL1/NOP2/sun family putative RNA methylase
MDKYQNIRNNIIDRYSCLVDDEKKFADSINIPLKQSFRVNTLKEKKKTVINKLKEYDSNIKTTKWNDNAHISELNNLGSSLEHFVGQIYIQELTSMIPPLIVKDLIKDIKIIDCCAAPGSKTTQIAAMMENKGHIIANDARHARLKSLRGNLDRLGVTNTSVTLRDFKSFPNTSADLYFVDAPCSSEGTIRKKNTVARTWKERDYLRFNKLQNGLLSKACEMAPSGSTIVYSTCTFSPDENEKVVSETLDKYDLKMKSINIENLRSESGITEWNNENYNSEVEKCMRVWPHHNDTDAFFIARMEKC